MQRQRHEQRDQGAPAAPDGPRAQDEGPASILAAHFASIHRAQQAQA